MDKIAANNHFVTLKKEVKKAKAMVCGNLIRKINKLEQEKEKLEDETKVKKVENRIANTLNEIKSIKTLDSYTVAKKATLKFDPNLWDKVISDCKVTVEERSTARLIVKNNVQKQVQKFRTEYKDCDEWLNEYIEFREKKREIKETTTKPFKRKNKMEKNADERKNKKPSARKENVSKLNAGWRLGGTRKSARHDSKKLVPMKTDDLETADILHPSWEVKRKQKAAEKELLKVALSGVAKHNRIKFDT